MKHLLTALLAALVLVFAVTTGAAAAGAGAVSVTQNDHNITLNFTDVNPCSGAPGIFTVTGNQVFHITTLANNTFWLTGTLEGTFTFVPFDSAQPTYTGHATSWFGDNNNLKNGTETSTFSIHAVGSDGSRLRFHDVAHVALNASGVPVVSFDKMSCG